MLKDKTGKTLEVGQLVDLHIPMVVTALVIDVKHHALEIPGSGLMPACVMIQVQSVMTPKDRDDAGNLVVPCYVVKDASIAQKQVNEQVNEQDDKNNVVGFKN